MITKEQKQEIINDLLAKNLPLDLLVEVKDHMEEQINHKMDFENKPFEIAYDEVKKSWEKDLELKITFWLGKKRTNFHINILKQTEHKFLKKSLLYFLPFFITGILINFYDKNWAKQFYYFSYLLISANTIISVLVFFKYYNSTSIREERKISIYQKGALLYFISGIYVIIFNLMSFDNRFEKFYNAVSSIFSGDYSISNFFAILYTNIFIFGWVYGLHCFLQYRNTVIDLKNRINLKL